MTKYAKAGKITSKSLLYKINCEKTHVGVLGEPEARNTIAWCWILMLDIGATQVVVIYYK
jgi:hypothetical protein